MVVVGRLWTRDYETQNGRGSTSQIRAEAVGPDLRHGWAEYSPRAPGRAARGGRRAEQPGEFPDVAPFDEPPAGEDYIDASAALSSVDPDPEVREPALH